MDRQRIVNTFLKGFLISLIFCFPLLFPFFAEAKDINIGAAGDNVKILGTNLCFGSDCRTSWATITGAWNTNGNSIYYNNGNIGIGTSNPVAGLDNNRTEGFRTLGSVLFGGALYIGSGNRLLMVDNSGNVIATTTSSFVGLPSSSVAGQTLRSNGTSWLANSVLYNNGTNVGVGTTNTTNKLTVNGNIEIKGNPASTRYILTDEINTGTTQLIMQAGAGSSAYGGAVNLYANSHATKPGWVTMGISSGAGIAGTATEGRFTVNNQGLAGGTDLLTVLRTGNVGINTTNPTQKLHVAGGAQLDAISFGVTPGATQTLALSTVEYVNAKVGGSGGVGAGTSGQTLRHNGTGWIANSLFYNNGTNVGIGATTPNNNLEVRGASGLRISDPANVYRASLVFGNLNNNWNSGIRTYDSGDAEMRIWHANSLGQIVLATGYNGESTTTMPTDGLFIDQNKIGIGYASPAAATGKLMVNGNVGIGTTAPNASLDIYNGSIANRTASINHYRNVLMSYLGNNAQTGTLKIVLPKQADTMIDITIKGYNYTGIGAWEARVSGYVYSGTGGGWYTGNHKAQIIGSAPFTQIRLAYDGAKPVILLGNTSTVWTYGSVEVTDVSTTFSSITDWGTGWSSSLITSEAGLTIIATPAIRTYTNSGGNFGIGTTNPSRLLHVAGTGIFDGLAEGITPGASQTFALTTVEYVNTKVGGSGGVGAGTSGQTLRHNGTGWTANSLLYNNGTNVGVGTTNPGAKLDVTSSSGLNGALINTSGTVSTVGGDTTYGLLVNHSRMGTDNSSVSFGIYANNTAASSGNNHSIYGVYGYVKTPMQFSGNSAVGLQGTVEHDFIGGASVSAGYMAGVVSRISFVDDSGTFTMPTSYGFKSDLNVTANKTITNYYGAFLGAKGGSGTVTNTWGVYQADTNGKNYFAGNVGIGVTNPIAKFNLVGSAGDWPTLGSATGSNFLLGSTDNLWGLFAGLKNSSGGAWLQVMRKDSATAYNLALQPVGGNVGINTTNPTQKLQVAGGAQLDAISFGVTPGATQTLALSTVEYVNAKVGGSGGVGTGTTGQTLRHNGTGWIANSLFYNNGTNIGIGTTTPTNKLHIYGGASGGTPYQSNGGLVIENSARASMQFLSPNTNDQYIFFGDAQLANRAWVGYDHNIDQLLLHTGSTTYMDGNVGIGTTAPRYRLDLANVNDTSQADYIGLGPYNGPLGGGGTTLGSGIIWKGNYTGYTKRSAGIVQIAESNYFQSGLAFFTNGTADATTDWSERMRISKDGNVGIGTTNPGAKLEINSNAITNQLNVYNNAGGFVGTMLHIDQITRGDTTAYNLLNIENSAGTALFVRGDRNVGINTTNPTQKLHVAGGGQFDAVALGVTPGDSQTLALTTVEYVKSKIGGGVGPGTTGQTLRHNGTSWIANSLFYNNGTNVGVGTTNPAQKLDVSGVIKTSSHILQGNTINRSLVSWSQAGASTGAVIITLPGTAGSNHGMVQMEINVYEYNSLSATKFICGGHNWSTQWYNYSCSSIGLSDKKVRLGVKDGKYVVIIGEVGSVWSYGHVVLSQITNPEFYSGNMDLSGPYTIALDNNAETYTWVSADLNKFSARKAYFAGNVGIGTAGPGDILHIKNSTGSNNLRLERSGTTLENTLALYTGATEDWEIGTALGTVGSDLDFYKFAAPAGLVMRLTTGGNVGINTTNPTQKLHVAGGGQFDAVAYGVSPGASQTLALATVGYVNASLINGTGPWQRTAPYIYPSTLTDNVGIGITNPATKLAVYGDGARITVRDDSIATNAINLGADTSGNGILQMYNSSGVEKIRMYSHPSAAEFWIMDSNVGIGTTAPGALLEVGGDTYISGKLGVGALAGSYSLNVAKPTAYVNFQSTTGTNYALFKLNNTGGDFYIGRENSTGNGLTGTTVPAYSAVLNAQGTAPLIFVTNNVPAMTILNGGNVGIGTTTPAQKLQVASDGIYSQSQSGQVYISGATTPGKRLMLGYDTTNNFAFLEGVNFGTSYSPIILNPVAGNVGINTTNPTQKLHVAGGGQFDAVALGVTPGDSQTLALTTVEYVKSKIGGGVGPGTTGQTLRHNGTSWIADSTVYNNGTNVGVGTSTPHQKLEVQGTLRIQTPAMAGYAEILSNANGPIYTGNGDLQFYSNNAAYNTRFYSANRAVELFTILNGGNIGIGNNGPGAKLAINQGAYGLPVTTSTVQTYGALRIQADSGGNVVLDMGTAGGTSGTWLQTTNRTDLSQEYPLLLNPNGGSVGIGTTNPANYKLVVSGTGLGSGISFGISGSLGQSGGDYDGVGYNFRNTATTGSYLYNYADTASRLEFTSGGFRFKTAPAGAIGNAITFTNAMTVLQGGNVGINTTNPTQKLHVAGGGQFDAVALGVTPGDSQTLALTTVEYVKSKIGGGVGPGTTGQTLRHNGTSWIANSTIYNNGTNVGVGMTNPSQKLDVAGNIMLNRNNLTWSREQYNFASSTVRANIDPFSIKIWDNYTGASAPTSYGTLLDIYGYSGHEQSQLYFASDGSIRYRDAFYSETSFSPWSTLLLSTADVSSSGNLRITGSGVHYISTGNVGIGTTAPDSGAKLEVEVSDSDTGALPSAASLGFRLNNSNGTNNTNIGFTFGAGAASGAAAIWTQLVNAGSAYGDLAFGNRSASGFTEKMRILSTGNVGINTTNPTQKLHVAGGAQLDLVSYGITPGDSQTLALTTVEYVKSKIGGGVGPGTTGQTLRHNGTSWIANSLLYNNGTNVGIGTTTPGAKLHLFGASGIDSLTTSMIIEDNAFNYPSLVFRSTDAKGAITVNGGNFSFWSDDQGAGNPWVSSTDRKMVIQNNGNVGIGTTNPGTKSEIYRLETVNRQSYSDILTISAAANTMPWTGHGGGILFRATNYDSGTNLVDSARIGSTITNNSSAHTGAGLFFDVSPLDNGALARAMTILPSGNVGIGTVAPGAALEVMTGTSAEGDQLLLNPTDRSISIIDRYSSTDFSARIWATWPAVGILNFGVNASTGAPSTVVPTLTIRNASGSGTVGNVGINTTNPTQKLHVAGGVQLDLVSYGITPGDSQTLALTTVEYVKSKIGGGVGPGTTGQTLRHNGTSWIASSLLYNNGTNIGIGTTNPGAKLDITQTEEISSANQLRIVSRLKLADSSGGRWDYMGTGLAFSTSGAVTPGTYDAGVIYGIGGPNSDDSSGSLAFYTRNSNTLSEALRINNLGNVGIGTSTPTAKLYITAPDTTSDMSQLRIGSAANNYGSYTFRQRTTGGYANQYLALDIINNSGTFANTMAWSGANVGIGTSNPGALLHVGASAGATTVISSFVYGSVTSGLTFQDPAGLTRTKATLVVGSNYADASGNLLNVYTNGKDGALFVKASGYVGMGTTTPTQKLHVTGGAQFDLVSYGITPGDSQTLALSTVEYVKSKVGGAGGVGTGTSGQTLRHNGTSWIANSLLFNNGTNVGIGTTLPSGKLQIVGSSTNRVIISNSTPGDVNTDSPKLSFWGNNTDPAFIVGPSLQKINTGPNGSGRLAFLQHVEGNYTNETEVMSIMPNGNVGIGTTSPGGKLHIVDTSGIMMVADQYGNNNSASTIRMRKSRGTTASPLILANSDWMNSFEGWGYDGATFRRGSFISSVVNGTPSASNMPTDLVFAVNAGAADAVERMRIDKTGNVGIGATPAVALDLPNGGFRSSTGMITGLGGAGNRFIMTTNSGSLYRTPLLSNDNDRDLTINGGLIYKRTNVATANYTASSSDYIIGYNGPGGTITLPGALCTAGRSFLIANEANTSTVAVTTDNVGTVKISGDDSITLQPYWTIPVYCNGSNWFIY